MLLSYGGNNMYSRGFVPLDGTYQRNVGSARAVVAVGGACAVSHQGLPLPNDSLGRGIVDPEQFGCLQSV